LSSGPFGPLGIKRTLLGGVYMIKFYDNVEKAAKWLLVISLAVMAILNFSNVLSRYVFHASLSFTEEITTNLFVYNTFIGAAIAARRGAHLGLTLISDRLNQKHQNVLAMIVAIIAAGLFAVLIYMGSGMVQSQIEYGQKTAALGIPEWWFGMAIPLGAFFVMVSFLVGGYETFKSKEVR